MSNKRKNIEESLLPGLELPDERFSILRWEDVEVDVTDEEIEDIKRAGL